MLSDVDAFNYNFFSLKVSFISYINLWAKFQNNRQSYLHPLESSTFQGSVFWTLALSYLRQPLTGFLLISQTENSLFLLMVKYPKSWQLIMEFLKGQSLVLCFFFFILMMFPMPQRFYPSTCLLMTQTFILSQQTCYIYRKQ